ncbi:MAG: cytochrome c biogenesis protein CcsA [Melioribacteraceae bacterium]|nr:cytochrome c biogenesis protein CcsA [Melioribacteraceae bacterium]
MIQLIHALNIVLPAVYIITLTAYLMDFRKQTSLLNNSKRIFLFITIGMHFLYLAARTIEFNHFPITNKFEIFTLIAFSISFSYFILELLSDVRGTGLFIIIIPFVFQFISSLFIKDLTVVPEVLLNRLLSLHVISAMLGYSGFAMSAVYGLLYAALYKQLKLNKFGLIFERLPSLETLEKMTYYSVIIGFVLLTFAIAIGIIWLPEAFPNFSYLDPKIISTTLVWIIFGVGILAKSVGNWYGKRVIKLYLSGFILAMLSMIFTNILAKSFHVFY